MKGIYSLCNCEKLCEKIVLGILWIFCPSLLPSGVYTEFYMGVNYYDSAGGPWLPEVICNPVAIYGMMIFWIPACNLGLASDIQYTRDNLSQMHVHLRNSNNECLLGFKSLSSVWKYLQHNWWDLVLVETCLVQWNYHVLKIYHPKLWLILYSFLAYRFILFWNHSFILVSPCQMLYSKLLFGI